MRTFVLLAALLLLAPLAAASWLPPPPFRELAWAGEDAMLTNDEHDVGVLDLATGRFAVLSGASASAAPEVATAASPDGRWVAYAYGHPRVEGPVTSGDVSPGATLLYDARHGEDRVLLDSGATALAGSPRHLALAHWTEGLLVVPWAAPEQRRTLAMPKEFDPRSVPALVFSADGAVLAALQTNGTLPDRVFLVPLEGGAPRVLASTTSSFELLPVSARDEVCCESSPNLRIALSPDGSTLALALFPNAGPKGEGRLRLYDTQRLTLLHEAVFPGDVTALAWGRGGLAAAWRAFPDESRPRAEGTLRVLGADGNVTADRPHGDAHVDSLAWSPNGTQLAAGVGGALHLYDVSLTLQRTLSLPPSERICCLRDEPRPQRPADDDEGNRTTGIQSGEPPEAPRPVPTMPAAVFLAALAALALATRRRR